MVNFIYMAIILLISIVFDIKREMLFKQKGRQLSLLYYI